MKYEKNGIYKTISGETSDLSSHIIGIIQHFGKYALCLHSYHELDERINMKHVSFS